MCVCLCVEGRVRMYVPVGVFTNVNMNMFVRV